jgi:hypothetical protein
VAHGWTPADLAGFRGFYTMTELLEMQGRGFSAADLRGLLGL